MLTDIARKMLVKMQTNEDLVRSDLSALCKALDTLFSNYILRDSDSLRKYISLQNCAEEDPPSHRDNTGSLFDQILG